MTDSATRALDPLSAAEIRARMRTKELAPWQVLLAADAGCEGAMAIMPAPGQPLAEFTAYHTAVCRGMGRVGWREVDLAAAIEIRREAVIRWALQLDGDAREGSS